MFTMTVYLICVCFGFHLFFNSSLWSLWVGIIMGICFNMGLYFSLKTLCLKLLNNLPWMILCLKILYLRVNKRAIGIYHCPILKQLFRKITRTYKQGQIQVDESKEQLTLQNVEICSNYRGGRMKNKSGSPIFSASVLKTTPPPPNLNFV